MPIHTLEQAYALQQSLLTILNKEEGLFSIVGALVNAQDHRLDDYYQYIENKQLKLNPISDIWILKPESRKAIECIQTQISNGCILSDDNVKIVLFLKNHQELERKLTRLLDSYPFQQRVLFITDQYDIAIIDFKCLMTDLKKFHTLLLQSMQHALSSNASSYFSPSGGGEEKCSIRKRKLNDAEIKTWNFMQMLLVKNRTHPADPRFVKALDFINKEQKKGKPLIILERNTLWVLTGLNLKLAIDYIRF